MPNLKWVMVMVSPLSTKHTPGGEKHVARKMLTEHEKKLVLQRSCAKCTGVEYLLLLILLKQPCHQAVNGFN